MYLLLALLREKYDPDGRVRVLRASRDAGLARFLQSPAINAAGACACDLDGIYVQLDDTSGRVSHVTWLEELAHALQYLSHGPIPLSREDVERRAHECEVAECMLENAEKLRLSDDERDQYQQALALYRCSP